MEKKSLIAAIVALFLVLAAASDVFAAGKSASLAQARVAQTAARAARAHHELVKANNAFERAKNDFEKLEGYIANGEAIFADKASDMVLCRSKPGECDRSFAEVVKEYAWFTKMRPTVLAEVHGTFVALSEAYHASKRADDALAQANRDFALVIASAR